MKLRTRQIEVEIEVRGIKVRGRALTPQEVAEMHEKHVKIVGRGQESRRITDAVAISMDTFNRMVLGWEGATDEDGRPLPCDKKSKETVFTYDQDFVAEVTTAINSEIREFREVESKN